jgi:putative nucleotidyltransferase with HDIG domain
METFAWRRKCQKMMQGGTPMNDSIRELWTYSLPSHFSTYDHCVRVATTAGYIADYLQLNGWEKDNLVLGCYLHDLGKTAIPIEILNKQGALTSEDWNIIKHHPIDGAQIAWEKEVENEAIKVILFHHERWDGCGYPFGLKGKMTPPTARICAVIDAFDSMVNDRPYRRRLTLQDAFHELREGAGTQFDEYYVDVFIDWAKTKWPALNMRAGAR